MNSQNSPGYSPTPAPNSNMALVSLISGILGLTFVPILGSIVALITGFMARKEISDSGGMLGGSGMATAGLVLGFIGVGLTCCITLIAILAFLGAFGAIWSASSQPSSMLLPVLSSIF